MKKEPNQPSEPTPGQPHLFNVRQRQMPRHSIARLEMDALFRNATRKKVRVSVSAPWKRDGHWRAEPRITGLGETLIPMAGADSMQALTLALKCIVLRLESLQKKMRFRLVWPGTKRKFELREFLIDPGVRYAPQKPNKAPATTVAHR